MRALAYFLTVSAIFGLIGCSNNDQVSHDIYRNMSAEEIYLKGKEAAIKEKYRTAIKDYEALESHYPYGTYTDKGLLGLIHAYHKNNERAQAIATAERFIRLNPKHPHVDYAYYMKGVIHYDDNFGIIFKTINLGKYKREHHLAKQSFEDFKVFLEKFPNSEYAADARARMLRMKKQLADHEIYITRYYFDKKAYIAAANRAGFIITNFNRTAVVPEALSIMVKSYRALGADDLANDALRTLSISFPDSPELKELA